MLENIVSVILCGGSGTRLWPLSRTNLPKQFMPMGHSSLFETTLQRTQELGLSKSIILCSEEHRFWVSNTLNDKKINLKKNKILLEPMAKNTAGACALAAFQAIDQDKDAVLFILPSDHVLEPVEYLKEKVTQILPFIDEYIITFGIKPHTAHTGYGYIEKAQPIDTGNLFAIKSFTEKPKQEKAEELLAQEAVWNSGMFLIKAQIYLDELRKFREDIYNACAEIWATHYLDLDFVRFDVDTFAKAPADSIDYAVMEKTSKGAVCPLDINWSDLGSFEALYEASNKDKNNNVLIGDALTLGTKNSYIHSTSALVAVLDMENVAVIETKDAILVSPLDCSQDVKQFIEVLKKNNRTEKDSHCVHHRPWGKYESIVTGDRFQVKHITVNPKCVLSIQMHHHRSEHWVVVRGTAHVLCGDVEKMMTENESIYIPLGVTHRLSNPGSIPLELVEIQTGSYLGEDDIVRFDDIYGRKS